MRWDRGALCLADYDLRHRTFFVDLFTDAETMTHVGGAIGPAAAGELFDQISAGTRRRVLRGWAVLRDGAPVGHGALLRFEAAPFGAPATPWDQLPEVGVVLTRQARGQGIGSVVARELIERGFALGASAVVATVDEANVASRRMLQKAGMVERPPLQDADGPVCFFAAGRRRGIPEARF